MFTVNGHSFISAIKALDYYYTLILSRAHEGSLSSVDYHVMLQNHRLRKNFLRKRTLEGSLCSVESHVTLQLMRLTKTFLTTEHLKGLSPV